jgi:hypothetical protein
MAASGAVPDRDGKEAIKPEQRRPHKKEERGRGLNTGFPTRPGKARKIAMGPQKKNTRKKKRHLPERTRDR